MTVDLPRQPTAGIQDLFTEPSAVAEQLPIPPLRLRRVHLRGVGPDGARFDPLDLDFVTPDGAASRVLLSLTNTGGKSTLITLVSSLVVPAARAQVAGKNLGDYVLTGDTSHIVCEWEDAATRTRTITGTTMEWKDGRRQPGHKQRSTMNMHRAWYLFRTGPGLPGIDDLPFIIDGRRRTFEAYLLAVTDLMGRYPNAQWVQTRVQQDWTRTLEQRTSIDPVLFGYQMRMNDAEAGAEKLLATFDSPDNVVRFFVGALNNDRDTADYTTKLAQYADVAAQRPYLEATAGFGQQVAPAIELVAARNAILRDKTADALRSRVAGGELVTALQQRIAGDEQLLNQIKAKLTEIRAEATSLRREYGQISDIRLQLQLEAARARLVTAEQEAQDADKAAAHADHEARAWAAVDAVIDAARARLDLAAAQAAYDAADQGLGPLRQRTTQAAVDLAGRLNAVIAEAGLAASHADEAAGTAQSEHDAAVREEMQQQRRVDDAIRRLKEIDDIVRQAENARLTAVEAGWLRTAEPAHICQQRWQASADGERQTARAESAAATQSEESFDAEIHEADQLDGQLTELRINADRLDAAVNAFDRDLAAIADGDKWQTLTSAAPVDAHEVARLADLAERAASEADQRAAEHEKLADLATSELAHLDETGTAPTGPDVLKVLSLLIDARIGAVSGLEWAERNITAPDARADFIRLRADLAGGVIITDPARFADAIDVLTSSTPHTRTPVTVAVAPAAADAGTAPVPSHYTVLPHRSTWDRQWAAGFREQLQAQATADSGASRAARDAARSHRNLAAACTRFSEQWPGTVRVTLETQASEAAARLAEVTGQREDHRKIAAAHREAAGAHRDAADEARRRAAAADEHVRHAAALATIAGQAATAAAERPEVETARATAANLVTQAARIRAAAASEVTNQKELAAAARARRVDFERERRDIPVEADAPDPGGNVEVLRSAWQTLRTELSMAERDMIEAAHLERARDRLAATTERLARFQAPEVDLAEKLAGTISASSPETLQEAQRRADRAARELRLAFIRAEHEREQAGQAVREAAPPSGDRNNHIDFATAPQWRPVLPGDVPSLLARLEAHNTDVLSRLNAAIAEETDTVQLQDALSVDVSGFTDTADLWPHDPIPTVSVYTGSKDAAREQMRTLIKQNREAEAQERAATNDLRTAIQQVHSAANEPRWKDLDTPAAVRVRSLPDPDLVTEAPVLAQRLRTMAESAAADLRDLDTHRAILRDELVAVCRDQRRLLREVSRTSRLPDGLGDLSNQPAIKIRFDEAPDAEAAARLADRIDAWAIELAANPKRAQSTDVRSRWLADAIRDTVVDRPRAGPWTIEILKPRIDGKVVYCPPDRIPQEFSGGQVLTLAVLVYCALSGVRSSHRPGGARPPGTLILDNPFGAASAEALIAMQHRLAARTGLQLVCATGLHDAGVDAAFSGTGSVIVKLRNDGDLRRNLSFLRLRTRVVDGVDVIAGLLGGRDPSAPQNWVDATTYEIRP